MAKEDIEEENIYKKTYTQEEILRMIDEAPDIDRVGEHLRERLMTGKTW